jgi:uncharacterized membrane protein
MTFFDFGFWQDFVSNSLATLLGALVGIPIALWLNRLLTRWQEHRKTSQEQALAHHRRNQLLQMLRETLQKNRDLILRMEQELRSKTVIFYNVDTQLLDATSSVKYEVLDDLELSHLLDSIRYDLLHLHRRVELQLEIAYSAFKAMDTYRQMRDSLIQAIHDYFPRIKDEIDQALDMISAQLPEVYPGKC